MDATDKTQLLELLEKASSEMIRHDQLPYLGKFGTCAELGQYIAKLRAEVELGNQHVLTNLWRIFAPTCDWDDAGGSPEIADAIYALIRRQTS